MNQSNGPDASGIEAGNPSPETPLAVDTKIDDTSVETRRDFSGVFAGKPVVDIPRETPALPAASGSVDAPGGPETAEKAPELPKAKKLTEILNKLKGEPEELKKFLEKLQGDRVYHDKKTGQREYATLEIGTSTETGQHEVKLVTYDAHGKRTEEKVLDHPEKISFREWKKVPEKTLGVATQVRYKTRNGKVIMASVLREENGSYTLGYHEQGGKMHTWTISRDDLRMCSEADGTIAYTRSQPPRPKPKEAPSAPPQKPPKPSAEAPAQPVATAEPETIAQSGEASAETEGTTPAAPSLAEKLSTLSDAEKKELADRASITPEQLQKAAEVLGKKFAQVPATHAAAAAPVASGESPKEETPKAHSRLGQWFGKIWGRIKKGAEAIFKNRSRYNTLVNIGDGIKTRQIDDLLPTLKGRVKIINYTQDDKAATGDVESYDPTTRTLTLRRCRIERADGTVEDKDIHKIRWSQVKKSQKPVIPARPAPVAVKPAPTQPAARAKPAAAFSEFEENPVKPVIKPAVSAKPPADAKQKASPGASETVVRPAPAVPASPPHNPVAPSAKPAAAPAKKEVASPVNLSHIQPVLQGKKVEDLIQLKGDLENIAQGGIQRNRIEGHFERGTDALRAVISALDQKQGGRILRGVEKLLAHKQFPNLTSVTSAKSPKDRQEIAKAIEGYAEQEGAVYPVPLRSQGIEIDSPAGKEIVAAVTNEASRKNLLKVLRG